MSWVVVFLAGLWTLLWASPADAAPIGALLGVIAGKIAAAITVKAITGMLIKLALSTAMTLIMRQRMKKKTASPGISTERKLTGGVNSRSFILGTYATAGAEVAPPMSQGSTSKTPNLYLTYVVAVSSLPIEGLRGIIVDGEHVPIESFNDPAMPTYGQRLLGKFDHDGGRAWLRIHTGDQTVADSFLLDKFSSYPNRPWNGNMVGYGMGYMVTTFRWDSDITKGEPEIKYVVAGVRLYDPRRDSSRGGSGTQRWGQPATYGYTENPVVMIYNILLGIDMRDGRRYGCGADLDDLPLANWVSQMNRCDEVVDLGDGESEPRWRAGCEVKVNEDEPGDIIDLLLDTCCGTIVEIGGVWKIRVGEPDLPVMFITDKDFLVTKPQELDPFPGVRESRNTINATYPNPAEVWAAHDAPTIRVAAYVAEDHDEELSFDLNLNGVTSPTQVQRIMWAMLKDDRRWRSHAGTFGPYGMPLEPLDTVSWTSHRNGYTSKLFELTSTEEDVPRLLTGLALREVDPTDYDWTPTLKLPDPVAPGGWVIPNAQSVEGFSVVAFAKEGAGNSVKPAIRALWDPEGAVDARGLKISVRRVGDPILTTDKTVTLLSQGYTDIDGVLPNTTYEVQAEYDVDRPTVPTAWFPVTTGAAVVPVDDLDPDWVDTITEIAESAGIRVVATLPATGARPNEIVMLVPPGRLYRWDTSLSPPAWSTAVYGGVAPNSLTVAEFATNIAPVGLIPSGALPTVKTTDIIFHGPTNKLYRWNGTAYVATIPTVDLVGEVVAAQLAAGAVTPDKLSTIPGHNLVPDATLQTAALWTLQAPTSWAWVAGGGLRYVNSAATGWSSFGLPRTKDRFIPVSSGLKYRFRIAATFETATTTQFRPFVQWMDAAGTLISGYNAGGQTLNASGVLSWDLDAPAGAAFLSLQHQINRTASTGNLVVTLLEVFHITTADTLADSAVTTAKIVDAAIASAKLADNAATAAKIATGAITETKITDDAITSAKIAAGAVTAGEIAAGAITAGAVSAGAIVAGALAANAVTAGTVAANAVTAGTIAANAVNATAIAANAVTAGKVLAGAITAGKLSANSVATANLIAGAVTATTLAVDAVTAAAIAASAITSVAIAADAVTAGKIAAAAVNTRELAAYAVTAVKMAITDWQNLVPDNQLLDENSWQRTSAAVEFRLSSELVTKPGSDGYIRFNGAASPGAAIEAQSQLFPVDPGQEYWLSGEGWRQSGTAINGGLRMFIQFKDQDDNWLNPVQYYYRYWNGNTLVGNQKQTGSIVAPGSARSARILIRQTPENDGFWVGATPAVRRKNGAELVVDGSITATALAVNSVTTNAIAAGAVVANSIAAGSIGANHIVANAVRANHVQAGAINSTHLTTTSAVITGTAQIGNAVVTSIKINNRALYIPYLFSRGDLSIPTANNYANPVQLMSQTLTQFEGGGFTASFTAIFDSLNNTEAFGVLYMTIDGEEVCRSKFGTRTIGADTEIIMPCSLVGAAYGGASTVVRVWAFNARWDSDTVAHRLYNLRNMRLSISGSRR